MGDAADQCHVLAYCDASFADDLQTSKSTSGLFIAIVGPNTFVPITSFAKRQTSVSHSTTESEMVALEEGLRSEALPILTFWEHATQLFSEQLPGSNSTASQSWQAGRHSNANEVDATDLSENDEINQMVISQAPLTKSCAPTGGENELPNAGGEKNNGGERVHKNSMAESVTMDMAATTKRPAKTPLPADTNDSVQLNTADEARKTGTSINLEGPQDGRHVVASFESYLDDALQRCEDDLSAAKDPQQDERFAKAILHVSTLNIGAHAFDSVKAFFDRRTKYPPVQLIVAEDNEAVIKTVAKGRSAKLRHVARTHRVNLGWLYDLFRHPEIQARYVSTDYQLADIGTKAITKPDTWRRLTSMMGIKAPGKFCLSGDAAYDITMNKAKEELSYKYTITPNQTRSSDVSAVAIQQFR